MSKQQIRIVNGYRMVYMPNHSDAVRSGSMEGYVYEHRLVAEQFMGRELTDDEDVHHLDKNRENNLPRNLLVLEHGQHLKLHTWLQQNLIIPIEGSKVDREQVLKYCKCGVQINNDANYCSPNCSHVDKRLIPKLTSDELHKLVWSKPTSEIANEFGVSDIAVSKLCKKLGVNKPGRGFWRMVETGNVCLVPQK